MKTVHVIGLGGTISMLPDKDGVTPQLSAAELLETLPALPQDISVRHHEFRRMPGPCITLDDLHDLSQLITDLSREPEAGFVVVQGTDTIDETAFGLELLTEIAAPIIVTGAMRPPSQTGSDGARNLHAAIQCAAHDGLKGGVFVALNEEIHAARYVRKSHTSSPGTFSSGDYGPVGLIEEGVIRTPFVLQRSIPSIQIRQKPSSWPRVALLKVTLNDDGVLMKHVRESVFQGCILEGMGAGHVPAGLVPAVEALAQKIPVILASRTGAGRCFQKTYGFAGSETDLLSKGLLCSGLLPGHKARLLLLLLTAENPDTAKKRFQDVCEIL